MHLFLLQHDPVPGNFHSNALQLADMARRAAALCPPSSGERTLCLTPAYALAGVPWDSLKHIGGFYSRCRQAARELAERLKDGPDMLLSLTGAEVPLYVLLRQGNLSPVTRKANGLLSIPDGPTFYLPENDPAWAHQEAMLNLKSSRTASAADAMLFTTPDYFQPDAQEQREMHYSALAQMWNMPVIAVQQTGATDSLIYAGQSCVLNKLGEMTSRAEAFRPAILSVELGRKTVSAEALPCEEKSSAPEAVSPVPEHLESLFRAAVLGIRDYVHKSGMNGVVLGLSGGMDSALVACLAAEALGPQNVLAVLMPSPWSSGHSRTDAALLARNLGIETRTVDIGAVMNAFDQTLAPAFAGLPSQANDLTADNLQPRIRGVLLMAFANRMGRVVLATGNKSEIAVGYCTLYGDTVGALEPIGDLYKTEVYRVARWYNTAKNREIIPENIFSKAPSAELHPGQVDQDSLPPYELLDATLFQLLENGANAETLVMPGCDEKTVRDIVRLLNIAEFKRHQGAPILKLSSCTFGVDRQLPTATRI